MQISKTLVTRGIQIFRAVARAVAKLGNYVFPKIFSLDAERKGAAAGGTTTSRRNVGRSAVRASEIFSAGDRCADICTPDEAEEEEEGACTTADGICITHRRRRRRRR